MADGISKLSASMLTGVQVQNSDLAGNIATRRSSHAVPTVGTSAGTTEINVVAPMSGSIVGVFWVSKDALATSDSNYVTFALVNRGTGGATTAVLSTSPAGVNTSKATGGTQITAYTRYAMAVNGANAPVNVNDVLSFQVTVTGTLANSLTEGCLELSIQPS